MTMTEALDWFRRRKAMALSDRCQEAEDAAIEALDRLVARVMTVDEVEALIGTDQTVYVEDRQFSLFSDVAFVMSVTKNDYFTLRGINTMTYKRRYEYGQNWRCWTVRPSEEQKRSSLWKGKKL